MRNPAFPIAILVCSFCPVGADGHGQEKPVAAPAVFIVAVKGECLAGQPFSGINGRARAIPGPANYRDGNHKIILTRLRDDSGTRKTAEKEFKNSRAFRVVDSLEEADLVFHMNSLYFETIVPNYRAAPINSRLATQAAVVSAETLRRHADAHHELIREAVWHANTMTPDGAQGGEVASPKDLVKLFLNEATALAEKLAALPRPRRAVVGGAAERSRPFLTGLRDIGAQPAPRPEPVPPVNDDARLRIETSLVLAPVSVTDRDGKFVTGLTARNFQVFEDGVRQEIGEFGSEDVPLRVTLMLDVFSSTRFSIDDIQDASLGFVDQLRRHDRVMTVSFESLVVVNAEFTNSRDRLMRAILRTRTGGSTRLYDALHLTLTERLNKVLGRKAILLFTDGVDTMSKFADWKTVIADYEEAGVLVYTVRYDTSRDIQVSIMPWARPGATPLPGNVRKNYETGAIQLKELATRTGARYYEVENIGDTKQAFAGIAEELRRQYWLGYYPTNSARDGRYRKIQVTTNIPNVAIRARDGYRAPSGEDRK